MTLEDIEAELVAIENMLQTMVRPLLKLDGRVQDVVFRLSALLERLRLSLDSTSPRGKKSRKLAVRLSKTLKELARSGVDSITLSPNADESVKVSIHGGQEFVLPPLLGHLIRILARPDMSATADDLIGWHPKELVLKTLEERMGREITPKALNTAIHRLRQDVFHKGKSNPWLVVVDRRFGYRFALRRSAALPSSAMQ